MPEKPIPEQDPITSKSYAAYYVIATVILMATLFWALWDEAWGQRPWKAFQEQWKTRYTAFLNTAKSKSARLGNRRREESRLCRAQASLRKGLSGFQSRRPKKPARSSTTPAPACLRCKASSPTAAPTSTRSPTNSKPAPAIPPRPASKRKLMHTRAKQATVEFPDGSRKKFTFPQLEEKYNEIRDERTKLSLELGDVLKPVTAAKAKMDEYISDHMVDLTPAPNRWTEEDAPPNGIRRSSRSTSPRPTSSTAASPAT